MACLHNRASCVRCRRVASKLDVWQPTIGARLLLSTRTLGTLWCCISNGACWPQVSTFVSILSGEHGGRRVSCEW